MNRYKYSQSLMEWLQFALTWVISCFGSALILALVGLICKLATRAFLFGWGWV